MAAKHPTTMAVRALRAAGIDFEPHVFDYQERGGTRHSAQVLGVDEHLVVKTLIFERDDGAPLCVLMHGDREVSAKTLARLIGARSVAPCRPAVAEKHTGYKVGGTSPLGLRHRMPIYMQESIAALPAIYINGGARGFLVRLAPAALQTALTPTLVDCATG